MRDLLFSDTFSFYDTYKHDFEFHDFVLLTSHFRRHLAYIVDGEIFKEATVSLYRQCTSALASIFIFFIEEHIKDNTLFWARYIDSIFVIKPPDFDFLTKANSIHPAIKFTLEESADVQNSLLFLDTTVFFHESYHCFDFPLFVKKSLSNTSLLFSSCAPFSKKCAFLVGENHRVAKESFS